MGKIPPSVIRYFLSLIFFGLGMIAVRQFGRTGIWFIIIGLVVFYGGLWLYRRLRQDDG